MALLAVPFCVLYAVTGLYAVVRHHEGWPPGDFGALWTTARLLVEQGGSVLYDAAALQAAQVGWGMDPAAHNPFPYPPTFMLALWPLGLLGYGTALTVWLGVTGALYCAALLMGMRSRGLVLLIALLAPATTLTIVAGQGGFLTAALLVGGCRLLGRRPIMAGVLFGLLTYKPQFGLFVPIALVAAGEIRCIAAAAATAAALVIGTTLMFGGGIWLQWAASLPGYQESFAHSMQAHWLMTATLTDMQAAGAPGWLAQATQFCVTTAAGAAVWWSYRSACSPWRTMVLLVATGLGSPHAFVYDMPMVVAAAALFIMQAGPATLRTSEVLAVAGVLLFPAMMALSSSHLSISTIAMAAFLAVLLRRGYLPPILSNETLAR